MNFQQIRTKKTYEKVADQIKAMIENGSISPGDKLPSVVELAEQFNVGRGTVREALTALKALGLIEIRQGEGTFVKQLTSQDILGNYSNLLVGIDQIKSLLEVRKVLETSYIELAAKRRDDQDLINLQEALKQMEADLQHSTHGEEADWKFHYAIAKATKNEMLVYLIETISDAVKNNLHASRVILYKREGMPQKLLKEHRQIYIAIEQQDGEAAKKRLALHLQEVESSTTEILEQ